jgi:hypothetical protein
VPAKDRYHDTVVRALAKAGWVTTGQQVAIALPGRRLWVDLRATRESDRLVVLIEVKGFEHTPSPVEYLAAAVGQYVLYRAALDYVGIALPLYLAVPTTAASGILDELLGQQVVKSAGLQLVVFDPVQEEVVEWRP